MVNAPPSRNPANDDNMTGMLREVLRKTLQNTDDLLPAKVQVYDRATNRARVTPLIEVVTTQGERVQRADIPSIPVLLLGGGGFFLSFHLPAGSLGWIKASDRDISLFLQSYTQHAPNTRRLHSFEDAVFIPDVMTGYTIAEEDNEAFVLQNLDGTVRISMREAGIVMTAPQVDIVTGATTVTATDTTVTIDSTNTTITGDLQVDGNINADGDIDADGTITGDTDVVTGTISLGTHTHIAPSGGGPTSPPQPSAPIPDP